MLTSLRRLFQRRFPHLFGRMKGWSNFRGGLGMKRGLGLFSGIGDFLPKVMNMWGKVRSFWSIISPLRNMMKSLIAR
ncbi:hypothetical protein JOD24_003226 [Kroppenstedtia sanguinis]|uniref:hypothetical protein n=1 Tax=Kroppenstedtia sanguinis TaxID=1380684 RepID=UPI003D1D5B3F